jgi:hypothetical protein
MKHFKDQWNPVKNATFPIDVWVTISDLVNPYIEANYDFTEGDEEEEELEAEGA